MNLNFSYKLLFLFIISIQAQIGYGQVTYKICPETGSIAKISLKNDSRNMNWILETDGSQYKWIGKNYGWGLGYFSIQSDSDTIVNVWERPIAILNKNNKTEINYLVGDIRITVNRTIDKNGLVEEYMFSNKSNKTIQLFDIGINTPFNDNYPNASTCYSERTNAHIWAGCHATYVNAMRMGGNAPHLGMVLLQGSINNYEIKERAHEKALSNTRGVIIMNPEDITLAPNENYTLSWRIFMHHGNDEFYKKIVEYGSVAARSEKYVYEQGDKARVEFEYKGNPDNIVIQLNGKDIPHKKQGNTFIAEAQLKQTGDVIFDFIYNNGKRTPLNVLVISGEKELIRKRTDFIIHHQQMNNPADHRYGAYMVYDNEGDSIFLNDTPSASKHDRDEGRERLGMGVLLAMVYKGSKDENIKQSLLRYATFVHKLQDKDYNTYSNPQHEGRNRNYNYSWVANFYFEMYHVTGNKQYLLDGYYTLKALYRNFGHGFYAIDMPTKGYSLLKENGYPEEAASLLEDFRKVANSYLKNGYNYPSSEVNYEQSIVAPSVTHLLRLYLITKEQKYLDGAKEQLPLLESFGGFQPSYHLNEIAIRHWDGYWFGKREFWGDTFPHYWSTLTAVAYDLYSEATGNNVYKKRAENIVRNNLCQFFEDGKASCAFIYPNKVNGQKAFFYDPYANDQDWALVYYLMINE